MTKEEMRIAIAESGGWRQGHLPYHIFFNGLPNYPEDLNAILPLLPVNIVIVRYERDWNVRGNDPAYHSARNQSLALAACEFYLKWKGLWKE